MFSISWSSQCHLFWCGRITLSALYNDNIDHLKCRQKSQIAWTILLAVFWMGIKCSQGYWETLQWRHNGRDGVWNYQPPNCLLNRLLRCRSKKTSSSASVAFAWGIHRWPMYSPHKRPVTRKMFPLDDVIMLQPPLCLLVPTAVRCYTMGPFYYQGLT